MTERGHHRAGTRSLTGIYFLDMQHSTGQGNKAHPSLPNLSKVDFRDRCSPYVMCSDTEETAVLPVYSDTAVICAFYANVRDAKHWQTTDLACPLESKGSQRTSKCALLYFSQEKIRLISIDLSTSSMSQSTISCESLQISGSCLDRKLFFDENTLHTKSTRHKAAATALA
ncbi:hypothetical protein CEXT_278291 [Caerostris extrusa]|uniref:Uncharacterized protein n=1 Tax=Caerostris extrusa TaxID=172846 RepID=A0AAV4Y2X1_CAEEX|nr:hypothetical protein CEXT_278291 [Caerostris extrusa]